MPTTLLLRRIESRSTTATSDQMKSRAFTNRPGRHMMVSLRIAVLVASLALATDCASQGMQNLKEMNCSDEDHCQVIVTIKCHRVMFCDASVDVEGVNARGNNVFWKIADDETSQ